MLEKTAPMHPLPFQQMRGDTPWGLPAFGGFGLGLRFWGRNTDMMKG